MYDCIKGGGGRGFSDAADWWIHLCICDLSCLDSPSLQKLSEISWIYLFQIEEIKQHFAKTKAPVRLVFFVFFFNGQNYSLRFWPHSLLARNVGTKVITLSLSNTKRRNHHHSLRWSRWPLTSTIYALIHASSLDFLIITSPESNHPNPKNSDWRISRKTVYIVQQHRAAFKNYIQRKYIYILRKK